VNFSEFEAECRRLALLRALQNCVQYSAPVPLLRRYVQAVGHFTSMDRLEGDLFWLAEQDLVSCATTDGVTVATLRQRGADVAQGLARVPGVHVPDPAI